jgi:sialate O-acetylesterase
MQWPMDATEHSVEEAPAANHHTMRLFQIDTVVAAHSLDDVAHTWMPCTSETVKSFSAVAYHFGEELHRKLGIPVGLINTSWGASATSYQMQSSDQH